MKRSEVRLMMREWNDAGLLPARLVDELLWLFHGPYAHGRADLSRRVQLVVPPTTRSG